MKKLKKYRVWAKCVTILYIDVEAGDYDDAIRLGEEADGGEFSECPDAEWTITSADELETLTGCAHDDNYYKYSAKCGKCGEQLP